MEKKRFKKIYVEITNSCNLKCSFCPENKREKLFMRLNEFENIIKQIKDYTNLIALHVKGEPLLHPDLEKILKICEENDILVNITTNATLLEKNVDMLIASKAVRQLNLSLHSINKNENTDIYNFEQYIQSVFNATRKILKESKIIISYRLWNLENIEENGEYYRILKELENEYKINDLVNVAKKESFVKLAENAFLNQDLEFVWPSMDSNVISECGTCWGLRNQVAILVNGDVVPCCLDENGEINLGNIHKSTFEEILDTNLAKKLIKGFEENKIIHNFCKMCGFRSKFEK